jgi:chromosome segregation ATPase
MKLLSITAVSSGLLLAAITLQGALAQTKPDKVVTRDELRICMNSESELSTRRKAMAPRNDQNREEAAAIRAEAQELADEQKRLEEANRSMDRFNRRVKAHNARVQAARANEESFSADLEALNKALVAHNDQCGGISFRKEDKEAILKERESATK